MHNENEQFDPLHDDPEEAMRLENELMKLKMQAEFGAAFGNLMGNSNLPPEIENQFLQHVYGFEKAFEKTENTTVLQLIDGYQFTPFEQVAKPEHEQAWEHVQEIYSAKNMRIDFCNDYPLEVKYRFATEELPLEETMMISMPGMTTCFIYEEFHPNHAVDIENRAKDFIEGWFAQDTEKCLHEISDDFMSDTAPLSKENLLKKLNQVFDSFDNFEDTTYFIGETSYELEKDEDGALLGGMGYVEGSIRWKAIMENGEQIDFVGPFKIYLETKYGWWSIIHFVLPSWKW